MQDSAESHFSEREREAIYRVIRERRDVRSEFLPDPIPDAVLGRILKAAHQAPSVGLMQPWDFLLVRDPDVRKQIHAHVLEMKERANLYADDRRALYQSLKLEAILETPLNVCITCDTERLTGHGLGRQSDPLTQLYSTACAVQNLWLAARAESVGVGWVSILEPGQVKEILGIPSEIRLVAYLCVGFVSHFRPRPELEEAGWEKRIPLCELLHFDRWGDRDAARTASLMSL